MEDELKTEEQEPKRLPLDARLLSEAVIELNILRRNVGLYPPSHAIIQNSIDRTFVLLEKLLDVRAEITLGIARDHLIVDEYTLDKANPVFKEFALSLHRKGVASLSFKTGVSKNEVIALHEFITGADTPGGNALLDHWSNKGVRNIRLVPIDFSTFRFVAGKLRKTGGKGFGSEIWEDYVFGLLEGRLIDGSVPDEEAMLQSQPEDVAELINETVDVETATSETYDGVISAYLRKKSGESRLNPALLKKFLSFIEALKPDIKRQFLERSVGRSKVGLDDMESALSEMTEEEFHRITSFFLNNASLIPETLKHLIDKLTEIKKDKPFDFDMLYPKNAVLHDIEISKDLEGLFDEDHFSKFVSVQYQNELNRILSASFDGKNLSVDALLAECAPEAVNSTASEIMVELLDSPLVELKDYLEIMTKLTEYLNVFIDLGKFEAVLTIYNVVYSHSLEGRFKAEAKATVDYYFNSEDFTSRLVDALRIWGRQNREEAVRLARAFKRSLIIPLMDALADENSAILRRGLLNVLSGIGDDIQPEAVKRLEDPRWFVVRNMIFLLRETKALKQLQKIRPFARHPNGMICVEAIKTLLFFRTPDSVSYLKFHLTGKDEYLREQAMRLAGMYKVREAVPELLALLDKSDLLGTESYYKIPVVKTLGDIGDPTALPAIGKILDSNALFYRGNLGLLKIESVKSLSGYPPQSARPLLEKALKQKDERLSTTAEGVLKKWGGRGV